MAFYYKAENFKSFTSKKTSIGDGLRKDGSYKKKRKKPYRGQGK